MFPKKRKHKRDMITGTCRVESPQGMWSCEGRVINISEGGMGIDIERVPGFNEEILVYMRDAGGRELSKRGVVAWFINKTPPEEGAMLGVKFT
jgi:hypothetical protein